jgi:hypothetical protein
MILGFTGTSKGMTQRQRAAVRYLLGELPATTLHHGCCVGADAQAHAMARYLRARVVGHPPLDAKKRMPLNVGFDELAPPAPYLVRDRAVVKAAVDGVIAAPKDCALPESLRGQGTWTTIGYARKAKRRVWIVFPDGTFKEEK